jgi:hypothetical protein
MIGDTPYDIEAATRAGVAVVAVRCGGSGDDELRGAAEIYDDPAQLLAQYETSLIGKGVRQRHRRDATVGRGRRGGEEGSHADRR